MRNRGESPEVYFWTRVDRSQPEGCWPWTSSLERDGYARVHFRRAGQFSSRVAHRIAYELLVGPIPEGLVLDHLCRNRACVNPAHLEPVTHAENIGRGLKAKRPFCKNGHEYTPGNTMVRRDGSGRCCRACHREVARRSRQRLTAQAGAV